MHVTTRTCSPLNAYQESLCLNLHRERENKISALFTYIKEGHYSLRELFHGPHAIGISINEIVGLALGALCSISTGASAGLIGGLIYNDRTLSGEKTVEKFNSREIRYGTRNVSAYPGTSGIAGENLVYAMLIGGGGILFEIIAVSIITGGIAVYNNFQNTLIPQYTSWRKLRLKAQKEDLVRSFFEEDDILKPLLSSPGTHSRSYVDRLNQLKTLLTQKKAETIALALGLPSLRYIDTPDKESETRPPIRSAKGKKGGVRYIIPISDLFFADEYVAPESSMQQIHNRDLVIRHRGNDLTPEQRHNPLFLDAVVEEEQYQKHLSRICFVFDILFKNGYLTISDLGFPYRKRLESIDLLAEVNSRLLRIAISDRVEEGPFNAIFARSVHDDLPLLSK